MRENRRPREPRGDSDGASVSKEAADGSEAGGGAQRPIDAAGVQEALQAGGVSAPVIYRRRSGSTQDDARAAIEAGAPRGTLVVAEHQANGRGRHGRRWQSTPGGLTFSLVVRGAEASGFWPTIAAAVGVARGVQSETGVSATVKWPNDLYLMGRKAGGVLVERVGDAAIVGIGLNVNDAPGTVADTAAVSVAEVGGEWIDRTQLLGTIALEVLAAIGAAGDTRDAVRAEWEARSTLRGRRVLVTRPHGHLVGVATGFGPDGQLLVRTDDGVEEPIVAGDISVRAVE